MTTQAELAKLIDRSPAAVSQATKEGHVCAGYRIADWAEFTASGRVKGYHVPAPVHAELKREKTESEDVSSSPASASPRSASPDLDRPANAPTDETGPDKTAPDHPRKDRAPTDTSPMDRTEEANAPDSSGDGAMTGSSPFLLALSGWGSNGGRGLNEPTVPGQLSGERPPVRVPSTGQAGSRRSTPEPSVQEPDVRDRDTPSPAASTAPKPETKQAIPQRSPASLPTDSVLAQRPMDASSRTSVLPEGEDYFRSVVAGSTAHAIASIAQADTPTARALATTASMAGGAALGYYLTDKNSGGALIGASLGLLAVMYGFNPPPPSNH